MSTLRELFVSIVFKGNAAKEVEKVDEAADSAAESMGKLDKASEAAKEGFGHLATAAKAGFAAVAAGVASVTAMTASMVSTATEVGNVAERIGISAQALQEWQHVAEMTGGDADAVAESFSELEKRVSEAASTGAGPAFEALQMLGISLDDIRKMNPDEKMMLLADSISQVADAGDRLFVKDALFGEAGVSGMGKALDGGTAAVVKLRKEAQELGVVMSDDTINAARQVTQGFKRLQAIATGLRNTIGASLLPVIIDIVTRLGEWAKANRELITERVTAWLRKFIEYAEKLIPLLVESIELATKMIDKVGGIENALKIAAGGWVAFKLAGLAAMGEIGVALAALGVGIAGAMAIVDKITNLSGIAANANAAKQANATIKRLTKEYDETGDPELLGLLKLAQEQARLIADPDLSAGKAESINAITDVLNQELARRNISVEEEKPASAPKPKGLRKIGGAAGKKPVTLQSLLDEERKAGRDRDKLREIRRQAEELRVNTEGEDRVALDRVIGGINSKLGQGAYKNINELLAEAIGQDTGLAGAQLKPAGLGTTINNIDASITFNVGGIEVELPASIARSSDPTATGQSIAQTVISELSRHVEQAFRNQRSQIIG